MRSTLKPLYRTILVPGVALVIGSLSYSAATAQANQPQQGWAKICSKVGETDVCNVKFDVITNTGQLVTGVNLLQSKGKTNRRIFQVAVPSGRYIPEGIKVQIDNGTNVLHSLQPFKRGTALGTMLCSPNSIGLEKCF